MTILQEHYYTNGLKYVGDFFVSFQTVCIAVVFFLFINFNNLVIFCV
jgi:hypothetical protein